MNVKIFSPGGSGYQFFSRFLERYIHIRIPGYPTHGRPREGIITFDKILYLYSDPRNSTLTFYRKHQQSQKQYIQKHMKLSDVDEEIIKQFRTDITFDELLDKNTFRFLEDNFNEWLSFSHPSILFIKYEDLPENIEKILDYLELDRIIAEEFHKEFRPRKSDYTKLSKEHQIKLYHNYKNLLETQSLLDGYFEKTTPTNQKTLYKHKTSNLDVPEVRKIEKDIFSKIEEADKKNRFRWHRYALKYVTHPEFHLKKFYKYIPILKEYKDKKFFEIGVGNGYLFKIIEELISKDISGLDVKLHKLLTYRELSTALGIFDKILEHKVVYNRPIPIPEGTEVLISFWITFCNQWKVKEHKWFLKECFNKMSGDKTIILRFNKFNKSNKITIDEKKKVVRFYEAIGDFPLLEDSLFCVLKWNKIKDSELWLT